MGARAVAIGESVDDSFFDDAIPIGGVVPDSFFDTSVAQPQPGMLSRMRAALPEMPSATAFGTNLGGPTVPTDIPPRPVPVEPDPVRVDLSGVELQPPANPAIPAAAWVPGGPGGIPAGVGMVQQQARDQALYERRMAGTPETAATAASSGVLDMIPFVGAAIRYSQDQRFRQAVDRVRTGEQTDDDLQVLKAAQMDAERGRSFGADVAGGVTQSVGLMGEIGAGAVVGGVPGAILASTMARTPGTAQQLLTPEVGFDDQGGIQVGEPPTDSTAEAIARGAASATGQAAIEVIGGRALGALTNRALRGGARALGPGAVRAMDRVSEVTKPVRDAANTIGLQSPVPEYAEEVLQEGWDALLGMPGADPAALLDPTSREAQVTAAVVGVLGGGMTAAKAPLVAREYLKGGHVQWDTPVDRDVVDQIFDRMNWDTSQVVEDEGGRQMTVGSIRRHLAEGARPEVEPALRESLARAEAAGLSDTDLSDMESGGGYNPETGQIRITPGVTTLSNLFHEVVHKATLEAGNLTDREAEALRGRFGETNLEGPANAAEDWSRQQRRTSALDSGIRSIQQWWKDTTGQDISPEDVFSRIVSGYRRKQAFEDGAGAAFQAEPTPRPAEPQESTQAPAAPPVAPAEPVAPEPAPAVEPVDRSRWPLARLAKELSARGVDPKGMSRADMLAEAARIDQATAPRPRTRGMQRLDPDEAIDANQQMMRRPPPQDPEDSSTVVAPAPGTDLFGSPLPEPEPEAIPAENQGDMFADEPRSVQQRDIPGQTLIEEGAKPEQQPESPPEAPTPEPAPRPPAVLELDRQITELQSMQEQADMRARKGDMRMQGGKLYERRARKIARLEKQRDRLMAGRSATRRRAAAATENDTLADWKRSVRNRGASMGRFALDDFGGAIPGVLRKHGNAPGWDQLLEEAEEYGLDVGNKGPDDFRRLFYTKNTAATGSDLDAQYEAWARNQPEPTKTEPDVEERLFTPEEIEAAQAEEEAMYATWLSTPGKARRPTRAALTRARREYEAVQETRDGQGRLLAPSGQSSKLNVGQWRWTRTPTFKRWFGDWEADPQGASKVVNQETGEPLVVYHGTRDAISEVAAPLFVTPSAIHAGNYSDGSGGGRRSDSPVAYEGADGGLYSEIYEGRELVGFRDPETSERISAAEMQLLVDNGDASPVRRDAQVLPLFLRSKSVLDLGAPEGVAVLARMPIPARAARYAADHIRRIVEDASDPRGGFFHWGSTKHEHSLHHWRDHIIPYLSSRGYDAVKYRDDGPYDTYMVFSPEQIKSATGNRGTFDPDSPRILDSVRAGLTPREELGRQTAADAYEKGTLSSGSPVIFSRSPSWMRMFGHADLPVVMSQREMKKITTEKHRLDRATVENLPRAIADPAAIFLHGDRYAVVTDLEGSEGGPVVAIVQPDTAMAARKAQVVVSAYPVGLGKIAAWQQSGEYRLVYQKEEAPADGTGGVQFAKVAAKGLLSAPSVPDAAALDKWEAENLSTTERQTVPTGTRLRMDPMTGDVRPIPGGGTLDTVSEQADRPRRVRAERAVDDFALGAQPQGRPDLANPASAPEGARAVNNLDEARNDAGEPSVRADADRDAAAAALTTEQVADLRERMMAGEQGFADHEVIALRQDLDRDLREAVTKGTREDLVRTLEVADAWRELGAEQARAFRARQRERLERGEDRVNLVLRALEAPSRPLQKKLDEIRAKREKPSTSPLEKARLLQDKRKLMRRHGFEVARLRAKLGRMGWDLGDPAVMRRVEADPYLAAGLWREIHAQKGSNWDALHEYYLSAILSSPTTHSANIVGNMLNMTWRMTVKRVMEATINTVVRDPDSAQWGEFQYMLGGMRPGFHRAMRNAMASWRTELPMFEDEVGGSGAIRIETLRGPAIGGKKGRVIRTSLRALLFADEFQKSLNAQMNVGAFAYRIAKREGLSGDALSARIEELTADMNSEAWHRAAEEAQIGAFQEKLGKVGDAVVWVRDAIPSARYVLPFVKTPWNIFSQSMRYTPGVGTAMAIADARRADATTQRNISNLADQALGLGFMVMVDALMGDEDNPRITGSGKFGRGERELGFPEESFRVGNVWFSYKRFEPVATILATTVDINRALRRMAAGGDVTGEIGTPIGSIINQMRNKTFLQGVSDIFAAIEDERRFASWASRFASSWVPNVARATARSFDPVIRETQTTGRWPEWGSRMVGRLRYQALPVPANAPMPRVDLWGRELARDAWGDNHVVSAALRLALPLNPKLDAGNDLPSNLNRMLRRWNARNPEDQYWPERPQPYRTAKGETRYFTDEEYHALSTMAGELALERLGRMRIDFDNPTERDIERIRKALSDARALARRRLRL